MVSVASSFDEDIDFRAELHELSGHHFCFYYSHAVKDCRVASFSFSHFSPAGRASLVMGVDDDE